MEQPNSGTAAQLTQSAGIFRQAAALPGISKSPSLIQSQFILAGSALHRENFSVSINIAEHRVRLMHRALHFSEVVLEILEYVNYQSINPASPSETASEVRRARKSMAALATTCKTFHEPAMDILWAAIDGLEPLLGCVKRLHPMMYSRKQKVSPVIACSFLSFIGLPAIECSTPHSGTLGVFSRWVNARCVNFCVTPFACDPLLYNPMIIFIFSLRSPRRHAFFRD